jgi:hypothetical protein
MDQSTFWAEITFSEDDFQDFRRGTLTPAIKEKITRRRAQIRTYESGCGITILLAAGLPLLLFIALGFLATIGSAGRFYKFAVVVAVITLAAGAWAAFIFRRVNQLKRNLELDLRNGKISAVVGCTKVIYGSDDSETEKAFLEINKLKLVSNWFGDFSIDETRPCQAFYLPASKILLGIEQP